MNENQISVKDKLPELRQKVLVFVPDDMVGWDIGMIVGTAERQICNPPQTVWELLGQDRRTTDVTHWMLLPERPKQEGPFHVTSFRTPDINYSICYMDMSSVAKQLSLVEHEAFCLVNWLNDIWAKCKP